MASRAQNDNDDDDDDRETPSKSPNWLTGIVLPKIATGAANILSSFIANSSSSSSSSSDDDFDLSPPDGSDNENDYPYFTCDETDRMNKENGNASAQLIRRKSETKNLIEKLILQETFSREERDCLISIIDSRVTDSSTIEKGLVIRSDTPDLRTKAIVEAKQWTEKKKEASNSKLKHDSALLSQDNEGGLGSPVDMAKAYMRERPPWSSLSRKSAGEQTPSPVYGTSLSLLKRKASCLSSGSWSIKDEIRRVRSKATEEILKTVPSKKYNLSSFSLEPDGIQNTLLHRRIDSSSDFIASGVGTSGFLSASVADISQENPLTENLQLKPITQAGSQSAEDMRMVDEKNHVANGLRDSVIQEPVLEDDLRFTSKSCPTTDGDTELRGKAIDNGVALSGAREVEDHPRQVETCHLLSESSVEVPGIDENDDVAIDSSLSIKFTEEPLKASTRSNLKQGLKGKTTTNTEKGQGRKLSRYNKKNKGKD